MVAAMSNELSSTPKLFKSTGILFASLFASASVINFIYLLAKDRSVISILVDPAYFSLLLITLLLLSSAFFQRLAWIQPALLLLVTPIPIIQHASSMYGFGAYVAGIILLYKLGFFTQRRRTKLILATLYMFLCEVAGVIIGVNKSITDLFMPLMFMVVFLLFLFMVFRDRLVVYLREPKPRLSLAEVGLSRTEATYLKELLKGANIKQVAVDAEVKDSTVRNTMARVYKKMGVPDRAALMAKCEKFDIVD
jgi:DNA-binding CsgD family transcriptional regulator